MKNLTPDFIRVYINGNIPKPGVFRLNQGSSLLEGIATAGGKNPYSGKVEFIRFNEEGETKKEIIMPTISYKCPDTGKPMKKEFPYTSVGKAQADTFAKLMGGTMKNNPNRKSYGY